MILFFFWVPPNYSPSPSSVPVFQEEKEEEDNFYSYRPLSSNDLRRTRKLRKSGQIEEEEEQEEQETGRG